MSRPWTCPVCHTVLNLGDIPPNGKICCPTCGTNFTYTRSDQMPRRRESSSGGEDADERPGRHTPKTTR